MIGLDTNILVRYLAQDDPVQSPRATRFFEQLTEDRPGFVSIVTIVETVWVLESIYKLSGKAVAAAIERMLQVSVLMIQHEQQVFSALVALKQGSGSFADALISALGSAAGCDHTLTFDRKALRLPDFELL